MKPKLLFSTGCGHPRGGFEVAGTFWGLWGSGFGVEALGLGFRAQGLKALGQVSGIFGVQGLKGSIGKEKRDFEGLSCLRVRRVRRALKDFTIEG